MDDVLAYLKEAKTYHLATVKDGKPEVRPFGTACIFEGKLYIQTGKAKDVYRQLSENPAVAISACKEDGTWLRISATAAVDDRIEANQAVLDEYPELAPLYKADDGNCVVFSLEDAVATFFSFTEAPRQVAF
ncbi:MAG: pyridoxamine 5'-phosphate oxidase family protein [Coriobacteriaceae bacterium]|jgi:uncharacterized pyridoxamine 5'-phosphate oxidase family protein|nr:pyridoxamine 5'-phosphate oxidase family protein [Coriobacteriaceae bacterium]